MYFQFAYTKKVDVKISTQKEKITDKMEQNITQSTRHRLSFNNWMAQPDLHISSVDVSVFQLLILLLLCKNVHTQLLNGSLNQKMLQNRPPKK